MERTFAIESEAEGSVDVCAILIGQIERNVTVTLFTQSLDAIG